MSHEWRFPILAVRSNYDGDTFALVLDLGFGMRATHTVRLDGIDTPEIRGGTPETKDLAAAAKLRAGGLVRRAVKEGRAVFASTTWAGKYGRPIGRIQWPEGKGWKDLGAILVAERLAVPYDGGSREALQEQHRENAKRRGIK